MKKHFAFFRRKSYLMVFLSFLFIFVCGFVLFIILEPKGTIDNATIDYGSSEKFSEEEIKAAADAALDGFTDFTGCDLIRLWYDEEQASSEVEYYTTKREFKEENIIVLYSDFQPSSASIGGGFDPAHTYTDWKWIITRESPAEEWEVFDYGY